MEAGGDSVTQEAIADTDYDTALSEHESAKANVASGKAIIRQNTASVKTARINLGYCTIKSPVRGTIIERRVNIGQTVVAALNSPSLFLIAKDLTKMQVWASVNEADIGRIRLNMPVRFTVDAHGGQKFHGKVTQIRMNAQMTQNVVTYTVIVTTDNSRWQTAALSDGQRAVRGGQEVGGPVGAQRGVALDARSEQVDPRSIRRRFRPKPQDRQNMAACGSLAKRIVRPLEVTVGMTDGVSTEISGSDVMEGMRVVAGEEGDEGRGPSEATADGDKTSNPFLPKIPKGSKPPPGPM